MEDFNRTKLTRDLSRQRGVERHLSECLWGDPDLHPTICCSLGFASSRHWPWRRHPSDLAFKPHRPACTHGHWDLQQLTGAASGKFPMLQNLHLGSQRDPREQDCVRGTVGSLRLSWTPEQLSHSATKLGGRRMWCTARRAERVVGESCQRSRTSGFSSLTAVSMGTRRRIIVRIQKFLI